MDRRQGSRGRLPVPRLLSIILLGAFFGPPPVAWGEECETPTFDSTLEAIQSVIFNEGTGYGCANVLCHGSTPGQGFLNARVMQLFSHTHRHGVQFRIWEPPNAPCSPGPACLPRGDTPIYFSTDYSDPLQLALDPPVLLDSSTSDDRTYLYCSLYDNGATPTSPAVKRQSTSPVPPLLGLPGGPCNNSAVVCFNPGPNKGLSCGGNDAACDTFPGGCALPPDGVCDACPLLGGVTSEDEMFVLLGSYFVIP